MRQFFCEGGPAVSHRPGDRVLLDEEESHHLRTVLRGGRDLILNLTDGCGHRFTGRVAGGDKRRVGVEILTCADDPAEIAEPRLQLAVAVVKGKRFDWALEKAVELGVHHLLPLITDHGVIEPGQGKQQRWQGILKAALKQSARSWLPAIEEPAPLADVLARLTGPAWFGAAPAEWPAGDPARPVFSPAPPAEGPVPATLTVLIGPEGGWSAAETDALRRWGAAPLSCGPHILRTETAAVAALVVLQQWRARWAAADESGSRGA
ncbi:MAG: RsmE family RNA methyltransferase [bacterium]